MNRLPSWGGSPAQCCWYAEYGFFILHLRNMDGGAHKRAPPHALSFQLTHSDIGSDRHKDCRLAGCHSVTGSGLGRCGSLRHKIAGVVTLNNAEL